VPQRDVNFESAPLFFCRERASAKQRAAKEGVVAIMEQTIVGKVTSLSMYLEDDSDRVEFKLKCGSEIKNCYLTNKDNRIYEVVALMLSKATRCDVSVAYINIQNIKAISASKIILA